MLINYLQQAYLFQDLPIHELETAAQWAREKIIEPHEFVYHKGDKGTDFFVIAEGKVQLIVEKHGDFYCIAEQISAGGHFGELALLTGKPRSLHVRAQTRTRLLVFDARAFKTVLLANPRIHERLDKALAERLSLASREMLESGAYSAERGFAGVVSPGRDGAAPRPQISQSDEGEGADGFREDMELARKIRNKIDLFAGLDSPVLICGEPGTGRRLAAKQIHLHSARRAQPYIELDMRQFKSWIWEGKLFGYKQDSFPFSSGRQLGILEQVHNGTLVLCHAEKISWELQQMLFYACRSKKFSIMDSDVEQDLDTRFIFIADGTTCAETGEPFFIPGLRALFSGHQFPLPPLREHKQDILPLVHYYLRRYNRELGKQVRDISSDALGMLMKYDWPGNLTELSNVVQRAVMVSTGDRILAEHIFLGLSGSRERLSFNLLQLPVVRRVFKGRWMQRATLTTSVFFGIVLLNLFFGPQEAEKNLGITLCWYIGWPLLIISFFFLPRYWCSICALSAPGKQLQKMLHPTRRLPAAIARHSGWITALLCLVVFWAEIVFNAYDSPMLTGGILLAIAAGALLFSIFFERYTWCRYVCPLGALNAVFSMPSILELRANREMCLNQCRDYVCFRDTATSSGCPMFRHPFLVDNNKDCILCGNCIRNCGLRSIELNLRLAPRELWSLQNAKLSDNFLIISLGVIFFLLVFHDGFLSVAEQWGRALPGGPDAGTVTAGTFLFWTGIGVGWGAYMLFSFLQSAIMGKKTAKAATVFGYGFLPLVLGGYLAYYTDMFIGRAWQIVPNILHLAGMEIALKEFRLLSPGASSTLLHIVILGGMVASGYATYKICLRLEGGDLPLRHLALPLLTVLGLGVAFLAAI
ncbi:MAG: sigma 54-interacting transcriptional regulator [Desulfobulbaceae bacterium]|nr:sigma 54-interacting transcriptional regulator [Desulfobulbaceae bacterium]